jgi:hypothetical protein
MTFGRMTAADMTPGTVFFHGYGWGVFERYTPRESDVVVHYRDRGERAKKRSTRAATHRRFFVLPDEDSTEERQ